LVIILVTKAIAIGSPHTNFKSMGLPHDDRPEHMNPAFISLSFHPKSCLLPKNNDETVRNTYFVFVLVNKTITIRNPYTKYSLLNVSYTTKLRCVN
jgi:hypothetical protein